MSIRKQRTTEAKIRKKIENGDGQGEGSNYRPYIRVGDFGSTGRVHRILSRNGRIQHFFSDLERDYYYHLLEDERVIEIKEQVPMDRTATMSIAESLGIRHPTDPVTGVPVVMTTDFLVTAILDGKKQTFARSVKFYEDLGKRRVQEKQTLEKTYWSNEGVHWAIVTECSFNRTRTDNIRFLMNYYKDEFVKDIPDIFLELLVEHLLESPEERFVAVCKQVEIELNLSKGKGLLAAYYFGAHKALPMRLDNRWNTWCADEVVDLQKLQEYWAEGMYGKERACSG